MQSDRRRFPPDLAAIVALTVATGCFALLPVLRETPVRILLGLAFTFFAPGYALLAAGFPRGSARREAADPAVTADDADPAGRRTLTWAERLALSIATSALLAPLVGIGLTIASIGVELLPIVVALSLVTLAATAVAARRRAGLPPDARPSLRESDGLAARRCDSDDADARGDRLLDVALVALVLLAVGGVGYTAVAPADDGGYTELAVLTEDESGALVAEDYPETVEVGETRNLTLRLRNHEGTPVEYAVVVQAQYPAASDTTAASDRNASESGTGIVRIEERVELGRFTTRLPANRTWTRSHSVSFPRPGDRVRLVYLLYEDAVPTDPRIRNADEDVHLWLTVTE